MEAAGVGGTAGSVVWFRVMAAIGECGFAAFGYTAWRASAAVSEASFGTSKRSSEDDDGLGKFNPNLAAQRICGSGHEVDPNCARNSSGTSRGARSLQYEAG